MKNKTYKKTSQGFSLVELMVAMAIGLVILSGIYHYFYSVGQSNRLLKAESRMQENARIAFATITSIVQQAGNFGCGANNKVITKSLIKADSQLFKPWQFIEGWEAAGSAYGKPYYTENNRQLKSITSKHWDSTTKTIKPKGTKAKKHTDILKLWYVKQVASLTQIKDQSVYFTGVNLHSGDIVVLNDCRQQVFAQVCECSDELGQCKHDQLYFSLQGKKCPLPSNQPFDLTGLNVDSTEIGLLEHAVFFVSQRASKYRDKDDNLSSLYVRYLGKGIQPANKQEILEGVESLQVLYGEDKNLNGVANTYVSADKVGNWEHIVSIKVSLLLRSMANNLTIDKQLVYFNGAVLSSAQKDRYLRRVYSSTIKLRNRGLVSVL